MEQNAVNELTEDYLRRRRNKDVREDWILKMERMV